MDPDPYTAAAKAKALKTQMKKADSVLSDLTHPHLFDAVFEERQNLAVSMEGLRKKHEKADLRRQMEQISYNWRYGIEAAVRSSERAKTLDLAEQLTEKGSLFLKEKDFDAAVDYFDRALKIRVKHYGQHALESLNSYLKYGLAVLKKLQYEADPAEVQQDSSNKAGAVKEVFRLNGVLDVLLMATLITDIHYINDDLEKVGLSTCLDMLINEIKSQAAYSTIQTGNLPTVAYKRLPDCFDPATSDVEEEEHHEDDEAKVGGGSTGTHGDTKSQDPDPKEKSTW
uniref:Uncharacterized protein n=1 Tax=Noccaea caerulescens TaxID=107243 RepID=A0A1J3JE61_NOCCA